MSIRVLHVITQLELGGAQKNALSILAHLNPRCYETYLVASPGLLDEEARKICGSRFVAAPFLKRAPHPFFDIACLFFLVFFMRRHKIRIVHTHSSKAGILGRWAARLAGVTLVIHTVHGWGFHDYVKDLLNDFYIFLEKKTARLTSRLIVVSEHDRQKGLAHGIGAAEQYVLIRHGIALGPAKEPLVTRRMRYSLGLTEEDRIVAMVACLKPQKNPLDFIVCAGRVLESQARVKFLLIGDGVLRPRLEAEVAKRGIQDSVLFLGWRRDVEDIYPMMDVFVLTSLWEGAPLVFLEAMHFARPIVAYDVCGASEVVRDGVNGFLVRPQNTEELSAKVGLLLRDEGLRQRMGHFGRHLVSEEAYEPRFMVKQVEGLYEEAMKAGKG
jgi:glycosyltransferase involved in cell wall biosynthesis